VHDYSENYACHHQNEMQSQYFDLGKVSLHVTILYRPVSPLDGAEVEGGADVPVDEGGADAPVDEVLVAEGRADVPVDEGGADVPVAEGGADVPLAEGGAAVSVSVGEAHGFRGNRSHQGCSGS